MAFPYAGLPTVWPEFRRPSLRQRVAACGERSDLILDLAAGYGRSVAQLHGGGTFRCSSFECRDCRLGSAKKKSTQCIFLPAHDWCLWLVYPARGMAKIFADRVCISAGTHVQTDGRDCPFAVVVF